MDKENPELRDRVFTSRLVEVDPAHTLARSRNPLRLPSAEVNDLPPEQVTLRGLGLKRRVDGCFAGWISRCRVESSSRLSVPPEQEKPVFWDVSLVTLAPSEGEVVFRCAHGCHHSPPAFRKRLGMSFRIFFSSATERCFTTCCADALADIPGGAPLAGFPRTDRAEAFATLSHLGLARTCIAVHSKYPAVSSKGRHSPVRFFRSPRCSLPTSRFPTWIRTSHAASCRSCGANTSRISHGGLCAP